MNLLDPFLFSNDKYRKKIKSRLFIFVDNAVAEEYAQFLEEIHNNPDAKIIEEKENFDMQGTLSKIITYETYERIRTEDGEHSPLNED